MRNIHALTFLFPICMLCPRYPFSHAINHAFMHGLIGEEEALQLDVINNDGNKAKHEGLGWDSPTAMSRSVLEQPFKSFRI